MDELEKTLRYTQLLAIYKPLLTPTQQEMLSDYFEYDLSLSEIADSHQISRSAVEDAIKKGQGKLDDYENKMGLSCKKEEMLILLEKMKEISKDGQMKAYLEELEGRMK